MTPKARLRPGTPDDRAAVVALVESEGLSADGIHAGLAGFMVAEEEGRVIGVAGLERYEDFGLLRSVAVAGDRRGLGLGARLTGAVVDQARRERLVSVYALTTTAIAYFPRLGFEVIERSQVPEPVRASPEFTSMCPESATALRKSLPVGS